MRNESLNNSKQIVYFTKISIKDGELDIVECDTSDADGNNVASIC